MMIHMTSTLDMPEPDLLLGTIWLVNPSHQEIAVLHDHSRSSDEIQGAADEILGTGWSNITHCGHDLLGLS